METSRLESKTSRLEMETSRLIWETSRLKSKASRQRSGQQLPVEIWYNMRQLNEMVAGERASEMKRASITVLAAAMCMALHAATFTWVSGSTDWDSSDSYSEPGKPGPGDTVKIPKNATATVDDDSVAFVSSLKRV